jgi:hypothetical protein
VNNVLFSSCLLRTFTWNIPIHLRLTCACMRGESGRGEEERHITEINLESAGYGTLCQDRQPGQAADPCYIKLDLRGAAHRDTLASVYKATRRKILTVMAESLETRFVSDHYGLGFRIRFSWFLCGPHCSLFHPSSQAGREVICYSRFWWQSTHWVKTRWRISRKWIISGESVESGKSVENQ